jgi:hypothetical protein
MKTLLETPCDLFRNIVNQLSTSKLFAEMSEARAEFNAAVPVPAVAVGGAAEPGRRRERDRPLPRT